MSSQVQRTVRAGVFRTVAQADQAIDGLLSAGFDKEQITVVCSDETKRKHFDRLETTEPSGGHTPEAVVGGSATGALLAGATAAGIATAAGVAVIAIGPVVAAGAVIGGFIGAMMTRGVEKEAADYYDQAVTAGKILIAVEDEDRAKLTEAQRIIDQAGAEPMKLREG